jgi:hypothetical protein
MNHLDLYTPDICRQLQEIAETHQWGSWRQNEMLRDDLLEEIELTCHLHTAADVTGLRAGRPPLPPCPLRLPSDFCLDPASFVATYSFRHRRQDCVA